MKDSEGTTWHRLTVSEHDRDALAIARRLVMRAQREHGPESEVWSRGTAEPVRPEAVLINLGRMIEDWDAAAESE